MPREKVSAAAEPVGLMREELDLFGKEPYDVSLTGTSISKFYPISSVRDAAAPVTFVVPSTDTHYVDLSETVLYMRCKVVQDTGADLGVTNVVAPVNQLLHSAFQQVNLFLNDTKVTEPSTFYAHRAMIETILSYSHEANKTMNTAAGYYKAKDVSSTTIGDNSYGKRQGMADGSNEFELMGRPRIDLFHQHKYLPPSIDMKLEFIRNPDSFVLHAPAPALTTDPVPVYRLQFLECCLFVTRRKVLNSIELLHINEWNKHKKINYDLKKVDIKSYTIPQGSTISINQSTIQGLLPNRLVIALVKASNLSGPKAILNSPFYFGHQDISSIIVTASGDNLETYSLELDFTTTKKKRYLEAYYNLFRALGLNNSCSAIDFQVEEFLKGKALFLYEISPNSDILTLPRYGNIKIDIRFKTALAEPLCVICYTESQAVLHIDSNKNVFWKDMSSSLV